MLDTASHPEPDPVDLAAREAEQRRAELAARVADLRMRVSQGAAYIVPVLQAPGLVVKGGLGALALARANPRATGVLAGLAVASYGWLRWSEWRARRARDAALATPVSPLAGTPTEEIGRWADDGGPAPVAAPDPQQDDDPSRHITLLDRVLARGLTATDEAVRAGIASVEEAARDHAAPLAQQAADTTAQAGGRALDAAARTAAAVPSAVDRHPLTAVATFALAGAVLAATLPGPRRPAAQGERAAATPCT